jgi:ectoine hydroxylase-related dioxygenase (phytanoyl-CoA dioxygenase family)
MKHPDPAREERLQRWRQHGYFVVRDFASAAEIDALRRSCDCVLERKRRASRSVGHTTTHIDGLLDPVEFGDEPERLQHLLDFFGSARLCALLQDLAPSFAGDPWLKALQYFHEPTVRDWQGAWHRDSQFGRSDAEVEKAYMRSITAVRFRVACLPDDRLELVPGTHARWDTEEELAIRKRQALAGLVLPVEPSADVAMPGAERVVLEPGDACVFHAWMIHRGSYTCSPARRTLDGFFRYGREPGQLGGGL